MASEDDIGKAVDISKEKGESDELEKGKAENVSKEKGERDELEKGQAAKMSKEKGERDELEKGKENVKEKGERDELEKGQAENVSQKKGDSDELQKGKAAKMSKEKGEGNENIAGKIKQEVFSEEEVSQTGGKGQDERGISEKHDVKKEDNSSDEIVLVCHRKRASNVSRRRSMRIQKRKSEEKKQLQELQNKRSKKLAAKFIFSESAVTYRPPVGYYGSFGVTEKDNPEVIEINDHDDDDNDDEDDNDMIVDDIIKPDVLKKPKEGFLDNELIEKTDDEAEVQDGSDGFSPSCELELDQDIISNNVNKALDSLGFEDLDVDTLMNSDEDMKDQSKSSDVEKSMVEVGVTNKVTDKSVAKGVTDRNVAKGLRRGVKSCGRGICNEEYLKQFQPSSYFDFNKSLFSSSDESAGNRSDSASAAYKAADETSSMNEQAADSFRWRIDEIDNRGFGQHKELLEDMPVSGSDKDKKLLDVLSGLTNTKTVSSTDGYVEHQDVESTSGTSDVNGERNYQKSEDSVQPVSNESDANSGGSSGISATDGYGSEGKDSDETKSYENENTNVVKDGVCEEIKEGDETTVGDGSTDVVKEDVSCKERDETQGIRTEGTGIIDGVINITPDNCEKGELPDIVNLTGQYLHNAVTGEVYNIDNVDISQFTQIYLVDTIPPAAPAEMTMIKEANHTVSAIVESGDESEVKIKEENENQEKEESMKCSEKKDEELISLKEGDERKDKDEIAEESTSQRGEKKDEELISVKEGYERKEKDKITEDVICKESNEHCDGISTDTSVVVLSDQSKSDTSVRSDKSSSLLRSDTTWQPESEDDGTRVDDVVRLSPDDCRVKISKNKITVVDKPPRLRSETRGQYMCRLSRQFQHTNYKKPPPPCSSSDDSILYAFILIQLSPILGFCRSLCKVDFYITLISQRCFTTLFHNVILHNTVFQFVFILIFQF